MPQLTTRPNTSDEKKKELALASTHHLPIIPVRTEDFAPTGAFQYELATLNYTGGGDAEACAEAIRAFRQAAELSTAHDGWLRHRAQDTNAAHLVAWTQSTILAAAIAPSGGLSLHDGCRDAGK
jgi:hypothetical protein